MLPAKKGAGRQKVNFLFQRPGNEWLHNSSLAGQGSGPYYKRIKSEYRLNISIKHPEHLLGLLAHPSRLSSLLGTRF